MIECYWILVWRVARVWMDIIWFDCRKMIALWWSVHLEISKVHMIRKRLMTPIFHQPIDKSLTLLNNPFNLFFPHILINLHQMILLIYFFKLKLQLPISLIDLIILLILRHDNIIQLLYFLTYNSQILLILHDFDIFLIGELYFMLIFL